VAGREKNGDRLTRLRGRHGGRLQPHIIGARGHRNLSWAIANHNPEEAERCMAVHFDEAIGALLR